MSQNWQQPQQPQPPSGYGYPSAQAQYGGGFPPPPPPAGSQGNPLLAVGAALVATVVGAFLYALLLSVMANTDKTPPEVTQFAYAGVVVGALIGLAIAKLGGRNPGLWVVGAILALAAVFLGELYGYAMILHDVMSNYADKLGGGASSQVLSSNDILFDHFSDLWKSWKEDSDALTYVFMALAPVAAVTSAYRVSNS